MPRFTAPAPNSESRKALELRARQAALPAAPEGKGRWPFPVHDTDAARAADDRANPADRKPGGLQE